MNSTRKTPEKSCEICSKLTIETKWCHWHRSFVFIVHVESVPFSNVTIIDFEDVFVFFGKIVTLNDLMRFRFWYEKCVSYRDDDDDEYTDDDDMSWKV